jgi:hypothetical protein
MKFVITTGKIYLTYMTTVWGYYFLYHNHKDISNKTMTYWKTNIINN